MLYHVLPHSTAKQSVFLCIQVVSQTVKQKVWSEAKNREQNWGELQKKCFLFLSLWGLRTSRIRDSYAKLILRKSRLFRSLLRHLFIHHFPVMKSSHTESHIGPNKFVSNLRQKV